jgi:hypothetical protein
MQYPFLMDQLLFSQFKITQTKIDQVFWPELGAIDPNVLDPSPKIFGCGFDGIELVLQVVHAQYSCQGHPVDIARGRGIGRMDIGMCIQPDDAKGMMRIGCFNATDGTKGRGMIA